MAAANSYTPGLVSAIPLGSVSRFITTDGSDMACGYGAGGHLAYRVPAPLYLTPAPVLAGHKSSGLCLASRAVKVAGANVVSGQWHLATCRVGGTCRANTNVVPPKVM